MINVHDLTTAKNLISADVRAATYKGTDHDVRSLIGKTKVILNAEAQGSGITNTVKLQSSPDAAMGYNKTTVGTNEIPLRNGTNDNIKLGAAFTQSGARQVKSITLLLKRQGTIAASKEIHLTIEGDNAGAPDGTAIGTSAQVDPTTISSSDYQPVVFTFAEPVDLSDATAYHIVLQGDFTVSSSNNILWRAATVSSGGNSEIYDSAWAADATKDFEIYAMQYNFSDITGAAFTAVGNAASFQTMGVNIDGAGPFVRAVATVAGGSSTGALSCCLIGRPQVV